MKPVPVLGFSALCAPGATVDELEDALFSGRTGLKRESTIIPSVECPVGEVATSLPQPPGEARAHDSRCNRLLADCIAQVSDVIEYAMDAFEPRRVGVVAATSASGNTDLERAFHTDGAGEFDYHGRQSFGSLAAMTRTITGAGGPAFTVSTACSSGANAIISAAGLLRADVCDVVIVGASDALCLTTYHGFRSLRVMDEQECRPFDAGRNGLNLGEGAAVIMLSRERPPDLSQGKRLFLAGLGASSEAHHMTAPDPEGNGASRAMEAALKCAGLSAGDVGYLNLHGTGTPLNDTSEARAVERTFGTDMPCSSTKGYTGHLLGSAAGVESAIVMIALQHGRLPRNLNLEEKDPEVGINVIEDDEDAPELRYAMTNSFAFGGNDTSLIFGREA